MKITFKLLPLLFILSCSHQAQQKIETKDSKPNKDPFTEEAKLLKNHTLAELGSALNIMRVVSDQAKKSNKEFCDLTLEQASLMAQQLRFMVEEKIEELDNQKNIPKNPPEDWRRCSELCNCYVYARAYNDQHTYFNQKMQELTTPQAYQCAKKNQWFCGSDLHQYLKSLSVLPESVY